jgi:hypothetical protein
MRRSPSAADLKNRKDDHGAEPEAGEAMTPRSVVTTTP